MRLPINQKSNFPSLIDTLQREATMEKKAKEMLQKFDPKAELVSNLTVHPHALNTQSFYEKFALKGIQVERVEPGCVVCSFIVPPRLTNATGNLCSGAIANLVDEVGGAVVYIEGLPMNVSVDMSISYLSTAKVNDELEIISRTLGRKGGYSGTIVLLKNKATGELIAEGRHSLFGKQPSKM